MGASRVQTPMKALVGTLALFAAVMVSKKAEAEAPPVFVNFGELTTLSTAPRSALGLGGELSTMIFTDDDAWAPGFGVGSFLQLESYDPFGAAHLRYAAGLQAGSWFGIELGYSYQASSPDYAGTPGVHAGAYLSLAYVSLALRGTIAPDAIDGSKAYGPEIAFALTAKIPVQVAGEHQEFALFPDTRHVHPIPCIFWCR